MLWGVIHIDMIRYTKIILYYHPTFIRYLDRHSQMVFAHYRNTIAPRGRFTFHSKFGLSIQVVSNTGYVAGDSMVIG